MKFLNLAICLISLFYTSPLVAADSETLLRQLKQHKARDLSAWSAFVGKDITHRVLPAPDIIIDYLRKDNAYQGYDERPRKPDIDPGFLSDIAGAVSELPDSVQDHIHDHVVAVFLVEELGGTAYGELLNGFDKNKLGFIVLDVGSLDKRANEWFSWKANSPFAIKGQYRIEGKIEQKNNDIRKYAIQYILLHEVGHLVGVAKGAHPDWFTGGPPQKWPFTRLSWQTWDGGFKGKSKYDNIFPNRSRLKFYSFEDAQLTADEIDETYMQWLKTDFVSLYAAINMYDDFAETYAMYVHVVLQNRPWKIRIQEQGKTVREIVNPILDKRCASKKRYLDRMFK